MKNKICSMMLVAALLVLFQAASAPAANNSVAYDANNGGDVEVCFYDVNWAEY